jgi:hypothetical protein
LLIGTGVAVPVVVGDRPHHNQENNSMTSKRYRALVGALLTVTMLGAGAAVYAQPSSSMWDSSQLPETKGTVKQYTLTPRGDVDGLLLNDGTEIKLPPHLSTQIVYAVRPGDAVSVRGLKARALPLVDAASVTNVATGTTVVDNGPAKGPGRAITETTITGKIAVVLHGKRGEVNGAALENGTMLRLPAPEAERMQALLQQGQTVAARGVSLVTPLGTVVEVRAIGSSVEQLTELAVPPLRGGPKGEPKRKGPGAKGPG